MSNLRSNADRDHVASNIGVPQESDVHHRSGEESIDRVSKVAGGTANAKLSGRGTVVDVQGNEWVGRIGAGRGCLVLEKSRGRMTAWINT